MPEDIRQTIDLRRAFGGLAVLLTLVLIGLIAYLFLALQPKAAAVEGGRTIDGIEPVLAIPGPGEGARPTFSRPMGVAFGKDGRIYVADTGHDRICVFDRRGRFLFEFGGLGAAKPPEGGRDTWKPGLLSFPTGVATDEQGEVYVADFRNGRIQVFSPDGEFLRAFGGAGTGGKGIGVTAVAVRNGHVYATDTDRVLVFTKQGELLRQFGVPGDGPDGLDHPNGIDVAEDGSVYVSDSNNNRVSAFDAFGKPLWRLGREAGATTGAPSPEAVSGRTPGAFGLPRGLTMLDDDELLVVDAFDFRLVRVSSSGRELARYGGRGVEPAQMNFPNGVDASGDLVAVADKENGRAIVVRLVGR